MTTETLTRQSPVEAIWLAIAQQPGFEGLRERCTCASRPPDLVAANPNGWCSCSHDLPQAEKRGWTVNQDREVLDVARLTKGWSLDIRSNVYSKPATNGDLVIVHAHQKELGEVFVDEGLRGTHAVVLAVAEGLGLVEAA